MYASTARPRPASTSSVPSIFRSSRQVSCRTQRTPGVRRFEELRTKTGAARNILADRLAKLVEAGILRRERYSEHPPRDEYRLTEKGLDLYPVIVSLARWGSRWGELDVEPPISLQHKACGAVIEPTLCCPECGEPVDARAIRVVPGPAVLAGGLHERE